MVFTGHRTASFYNIAQDRIRLDVEDADGNSLSIFLTRRLTARLAKTLAGEVMVQDAVNVPQTDNKGGKGSKGLGVGGRMAAAQSERDDRIEEAKPIQPSERPFLVTSIQFAKKKFGMGLTFKAGQKDVLLLGFKTSQLAQWLSILRALSIKAEWDIVDWPSAAEARSVAHNKVTLH